MKKFLILFIGCILGQGSINAMDVIEYPWENEPALHKAAFAGNTVAVSSLLRETPVDQQDEYGRSALHWAAFGGFKDVVHILITAGANVNQQDKTLWTPMHWAARRGYQEIVAMLLSHGAKNQPNTNGETPVNLANTHILKSNVEIAKYQRVVEIIKNHLAHKEMLPFLYAFHPRLGAQSGLKDFVPHWMLPQIYELLKKADR